MKTIEVSGKTVEEALSNGLKQLGVDLSAVTHEVLDKGSPGLFGMFGRLAKVRITVNEEPEEDTDFDIEMPTLSIAPEQKTAKKEKKEKKEAPKQEKPAKSEKKEAPKQEKPAKAEKKESPKPAKPAKPAEEEAVPEANANEEPQPEAKEAPARPRRERQPRKNKKPAKAEVQAESETVEEEQPAPQPVVREFPPLDVDALSADAKKAYEFISGITKLMQVDVDIRMLEEENQIFVDISGDTLGVLIGRRGDTLDAIQYLSSLTVNKDKDEYTRVTIDVEHYRAKREETLRKLAVRMANRARKSGRRVVLEPMNPYERRVLHSTLQDNPYVQTHSEGEEPYRRVIITLK